MHAVVKKVVYSYRLGPGQVGREVLHIVLIGVLMWSYIHPDVYFTRIRGLFLFLIAEWSQFLVTIFIQAQLLYLYSFNVLY